MTRDDGVLKVSAKNLIRDRADLGSQNEIKCMRWSDERQEEILIGSKNGVRTFNVVDNVISNSLVLPEDESCGIFKSDGLVSRISFRICHFQ